MWYIGCNIHPSNDFILSSYGITEDQNSWKLLFVKRIAQTCRVSIDFWKTQHVTEAVGAVSYTKLS